MKKYKSSQLLRDFIKVWFTENDAIDEQCNSSIKPDISDVASFHRNETTHHMQNPDQFDEENDS